MKNSVLLYDVDNTNCQKIEFSYLSPKVMIS